ncbi:MAG TPA: hypothetical protein VE825_10740 [Terriglobales bacterium]|jgi:hypothetical protein|nr:hypothetical protein [Terriglobales bacterium]
MDSILITLIRLLEGMFVAGWAGTLIVLVLTGIEDLETILRRDQPAPGMETQILERQMLEK